MFYRRKEPALDLIRGQTFWGPPAKPGVYLTNYLDGSQATD